MIRVSTSARNKLLTLEDLTEAEFDQMKKSFAGSPTEAESGQ